VRHAVQPQQVLPEIIGRLSRGSGSGDGSLAPAPAAEPMIIRCRGAETQAETDGAGGSVISSDRRRRGGPPRRIACDSTMLLIVGLASGQCPQAERPLQGVGLISDQIKDRRPFFLRWRPLSHPSHCRRFATVK
jgi:hypothetical protein